MANPFQKPKLPREIRRKLAAARRRVKLYVWLQGISIALTWLALTFWVGLGLDYLPVLMGASEMPQVARGIVLVVIAGVLGYILYHWILRRTLVYFDDHNMAVLLERHFSGLDESLVTSVDLIDDLEDSTPVHRQLLATTQLQALKRLKGLRLNRIFNLRPLLASMGGAGLLALSIGVFYVVDAQAIELGARRLYLLENQPWPRHAHIEVVGIEAPQSAAEAGWDEGVPIVVFVDRSVKVARGSECSLLVRADANAPKIPEVVTISYRTADGVRGRVNMTRIGRIREGYQLYRYDGKPLRGMLSDVRFDVVGYDHRIRDFTVEVVDSPTVVSAELSCTFPDYIVDQSTSSWLPRTIGLISGAQLPKGTQISLRAESNKGLQRVIITDKTEETEQVVQIESGDQQFAIDLPRLDQNVNLDITLVDLDNVRSERPYRVLIEAVPDLPPVVNLRLRGIGTAVTPDVLLPFDGSVADDYGVNRTWIEFQVNEGGARELELQGDARKIVAEVDFRQLRRESGLELRPESTLNLVVKAEDRFDLEAPPNIGASDHYRLEVVTPQQLLAMLEARELGLRQRFEQVISEMTETRDTLERVRGEGPETAQNLIDLDESGTEETPNDEVAARERAVLRVWSLRLLRGQRSLLQSQKSAQETLGVATSFRDIRSELVHNRVDSEDRKQRLLNAVIDPIEMIGNDLFAELDVHLEALVATIDEASETARFVEKDHPATVAAADAAVKQVDSILQEMDEVLQNMLDLETYNELLDIVRSLIGDQQRLFGRTKEEQKKQFQ
jgi:hypothetical protein